MNSTKPGEVCVQEVRVAAPSQPEDVQQEAHKQFGSKPEEFKFEIHSRNQFESPQDVLQLSTAKNRTSKT